MHRALSSFATRLLLYSMLIVLAGCVPPGVPTPAPAVPDQPEVPPDSPDEPAVENGEEAAPTPPVGDPTPAPPLNPWPLAADLFYLNEVGQVWRQPLAGDDRTAAAVTRLELAIDDFAVAPGQDWIAYRSQGAISVIAFDGGGGRVLAPDAGVPQSAGPGHSIAWSPDGSKIAYATQDGFQVYIPGGGVNFTPLIFNVPSDVAITDMAWSQNSNWLLTGLADQRGVLYQADTQLVLRVDLGVLNSYAWLQDGRLAFAPQSGGLVLLDPADLNSRTFLVAQEQIISLIGERADGMLLFFIHSGALDAPALLHMGNPSDLSFSVTSSLPVQTTGRIWNPTGSLLISRDPDSETGLALLDPIVGSEAIFQASGAPARLEWGDPVPQTTDSLGLALDLYYLAPQAGIVQIWRLPQGGGPATAITNSPTDIIDFDVSADNTQITYSTAGSVYRSVIGSADVIEVARLFEGILSGQPAFSISGRFIAYANNGIWISDAEDLANPRRLIADQVPQIPGQENLIQRYTRPRWSPDGGWLLTQVNFFEGYDLAVMPVTELGIVSQPALLGLFQADARWTADNRVMAYTTGSDFIAPQVTIIDPNVPPGQPLNLSRLVDLPVIDVQFRGDGRLSLLRIPAPAAFGLGPTSVSVYSATVSGGDLRRETNSVVINDPVLSPGGTFIAGLLNIRTNELGVRVGQVAIIDPVSGEVYIIEGARDAFAIRWGQ